MISQITSDCMNIFCWNYLLFNFNKLNQLNDYFQMIYFKVKLPRFVTKIYNTLPDCHNLKQ